uniref:Uncharacterized protein n=1 Tax=Caenorhabditis japonica TaxID=281687 RepID=A0A8R1J017_CAEJA
KFQETKKRVNNASPPPRKLAPSPAKKPVAQPPAPVVPKPKRNPDEELSDGEILSTDEEDNNK